MLDFAVPYIKAFKAGETAPVIDSEMLVYWHRPHLKSVSCDSTDICGSRPTGWDFLEDTVFVSTMTKSGGIVKVTSGGNQAVVQQVDAGVQMIEVPMGVGEQIFEFTTFQGGYGKTTSNLTISADCWVSSPCVLRAMLTILLEWHLQLQLPFWFYYLLKKSRSLAVNRHPVQSSPLAQNNIASYTSHFHPCMGGGPSKFIVSNKNPFFDKSFVVVIRRCWRLWSYTYQNIS